MTQLTIQQYLNTLQRYLARLSPAETQEVLREIESHIFDLIEQREAAGQPAAAADVLQGFGEPRVLAAQYVEHITAGAPPPPGFKAIQRVKRGVTATLYYTMALFGFVMSGCLLFIAGAKLVLPGSVGAWSAANGNSLTIGFFSAPLPAGDEILGWTMVPIAFVAGLAVLALTRKVLRVLKQNM